MSEDEYWNGTAKVVKRLDSETLENQCQRLCEGAGAKKESYHDSWEEVFNDRFYKKMAIADGTIYDVSGMNRHEDYPDICEASRIDMETVKVTLKFYNGGTCFSEMFEEALAKLNKTQPD